MVLKNPTEHKDRKVHLDNLEINVVPFKFKHLPMLLDMLKGNDFPLVDDINMKTLPKIGYIAMLEDQPIATGFLRKVEGNIIAHLEGLASNPYFGSIIRHKALDAIFKTLINEGKEMKLKGIIGFTSDYSVLVRAEDIGFCQLEGTNLLSLTF